MGISSVASIKKIFIPNVVKRSSKQVTNCHPGDSTEATEGAVVRSTKGASRRFFLPFFEHIPLQTDRKEQELVEERSL